LEWPHFSALHDPTTIWAAAPHRSYCCCAAGCSRVVMHNLTELNFLFSSCLHLCRCCPIARNELQQATSGEAQTTTPASSLASHRRRVIGGSADLSSAAVFAAADLIAVGVDGSSSRSSTSRSLLVRICHLPLVSQQIASLRGSAPTRATATRRPPLRGTRGRQSRAPSRMRWGPA